MPRSTILAVLACAGILGASSACTPTPAPASTPERRALTAEEYALACAHDPRAPLRIYGCYDPRPPRLLFIVDGVIAWPDTMAAAKAYNDSIFSAVRGRVIDSVQYVLADSAVKLYGSRAQYGVVLLWSSPRQLPAARDRQ